MKKTFITWLTDLCHKEYVFLRKKTSIEKILNAVQNNSHGAGIALGKIYLHQYKATSGILYNIFLFAAKNDIIS